MARLLPLLGTVRDVNDKHGGSRKEEPNGKQDGAQSNGSSKVVQNARRGPQRRPPDKTISLQTRHGFEYEQQPTTTKVGGSKARGSENRFPDKLHDMLSRAATEKFDHIVSWERDGRSFRVLEPELFLARVMPLYFKQNHLRSFQRQLNLYGFSRLHSVCGRGWYYHELFRRDQLELCKQMVRVRAQGVTHKIPPSPPSRGEHTILPSPRQGKTLSPELSFDIKAPNLEGATMEMSNLVCPIVVETTVSAVPPSVSPFSVDEILKTSGSTSTSTDDLSIASMDDETECRILTLLSAAAPSHHDDIGCSLRQLSDAYSSGRDLDGSEMESAGHETEFGGRWFHLLDAEALEDGDDVSVGMF